jgi:hypothetical protein
MRCCVLCCSIFAFGLNAEGVENESTEKDKSPAVLASGAKAFDGFTVGAGVNIGAHETNVKINKEFDAPTRVRATTFGGIVALGYQQAVCGNFTIGLEIGADLGGSGKRARIGGNIKNNSLMMAAYRDDYSSKEGILRQMFDNIGDDAFDTQDVDDGLQYVLREEVYGRFIISMRCLGGTSDFASANSNGFMTSAADNHGIWYNPGGGYQANPNAVFANFVGGMTMANLSNLGNGNLQVGYEAMREFTRENFPAIYDALGHMAEQRIVVMDNAVAFGPSVNRDGTVNADGTIVAYNILWNVPHQLATFFNDEYIDGYENIGVNPAGRDIEALRREIEDLYNPDNSNIRYQLSASELREMNNFRNKTSFGVCPYAAIKFGYFINEMKGLVYAKVGIMQLHGNVAAINDFLEKKDKFQKITPLFAVGVSKMLSDECGISVELSHAMKTCKKLKDIEWKGYTVENRVSTSKSSLHIMINYNF